MRVVNSWNNLSELVVTVPSVNAFKGRPNSHWDDLKSVVEFPAHELSNRVCQVALVPIFQHD